MQPFQLAERLAQDCEFIRDWPLCRLLLMNDSRYPWFILVPRRAGLRELHELSPDERKQFVRESDHLVVFLQRHCQADKINIAALGNVEPQLHVHHIARRTDDDAWPAPVWGAHPARPYSAAELARWQDILTTELTDP